MGFWAALPAAMSGISAGGAAGGGAASGAGFSGVLSQFGAPGTAGAVNGAPMVQSAAGGGSPAFWQQFSQAFGAGGAPSINSARPPASGGGGSSNPFTDKIGQYGAKGGELITAYLDNLENRAGRLSEMVRGPTMPFMPKLNTGPVGPNVNPGQMGLANLLAQITSRRG